MPKAKTIDRIELTRKKFGLASPSEQLQQKTAKEVAEELFTELVDKPRRGESPSPEILDMLFGKQTQQEHKQGYSTCPACGRETLRHDGTCKICDSCGWSACG